MTEQEILKAIENGDEIIYKGQIIKEGDKLHDKPFTLIKVITPKKILIKCDCGKEFISWTHCLEIDKIMSCGCKRYDKLRKRNLKHGGRYTRLYTIWRCMLRRCNNEKSKDYKNYGARNIFVCDEWNKFENFRDWAMSNGYRDDLTLDRINVNGDYEPENCRWVDMITQENNRTNNRHIYYNGNEYTLFDLSEISKVGYKTLHQRLYMYGWDIDKAVNTPSRIKNKNTLKNQKRTK